MQLESHSRRAAQPPSREARQLSDIAILAVQAPGFGELLGGLASVRLELHSRRAAQPPSREARRRSDIATSAVQAYYAEPVFFQVSVPLETKI